MTEQDRERAIALGQCRMLPGTWDKRFSRDVASMAAAGQFLSAAQVENIRRLAVKYRRQMPERLVPHD